MRVMGRKEGPHIIKQRRVRKTMLSLGLVKIVHKEHRLFEVSFKTQLNFSLGEGTIK